MFVSLKLNLFLWIDNCLKVNLTLLQCRFASKRISPGRMSQISGTNVGEYTVFSRRRTSIWIASVSSPFTITNLCKGLLGKLVNLESWSMSFLPIARISNSRLMGKNPRVMPNIVRKRQRRQSKWSQANWQVRRSIFHLRVMPNIARESPRKKLNENLGIYSQQVIC